MNLKNMYSRIFNDVKELSNATIITVLLNGVNGNGVIQITWMCTEKYILTERHPETKSVFNLILRKIQ